MGRKKRDVAGKHDTWKAPRRDPQARPTTALGTSLDRLVRDIKAKIRTAKDFWKDMPHTVCNEVAAPITEEHKCWNGLARGRYRHRSGINLGGLYFVSKRMEGFPGA